YSADELKILREFVDSDEYKKWAKTDTSYFRLAQIDGRLKKSHSQIAYRYLQATWQVEHEAGDRPRAYLKACLGAYDDVIADGTEAADRRQMARFLRGELLRRLGKFEDAQKSFEALQKLESSKAEPYPKLIALELDLIGQKDDKPHE